MLVFQSSTAFAAKCWTWQASAAEKGYFVTDDGASTRPDGSSAAPNMSYVISEFRVTATAAAGVTSATTFVNGPGGTQGIVWDGSAATQFWRDGGTLTNGMNMYAPSATTSPHKRWLIALNYFRVDANGGTTLVSAISSMTVALDASGAACTPALPPVSAPILNFNRPAEIFASEVE